MKGLADMADQPADGTVAAEQHNRLMGHYQRALGLLSPEQRETLRTSRPDAPEYTAPEPQPQQQPEPQPDWLAALSSPEPEPEPEPTPQWEPGTHLVVNDDGQPEYYEPPTPQNPNAQAYLGRIRQPRRSGEDDGSAEWAREQMLRVLGG